MKKKLITQLKNLQEITPDKEWKESSQVYLSNRINNDVKSGVFSNIMVWLKDFAKMSSQPAFALSAFVLILITGVVFANPMFSGAKPDDSLYIARIISEKAQINMTFNKEERNKLSARFATNHAKDIATLMSDPDFHSQEDSEERIANLSDDFNREINSVRESINYNSDNNNFNNKQNQNYINANESNVEGSEDVDSGNIEAEEDGFVFSAETRKDEKGLEVDIKDEDIDQDASKEDFSNEEIDEDLEGEEEGSEDEKATSTNESVEVLEESSEAQSASSTLNKLQSITEAVDKEGGDVDEINKALDDAERLFNESKFDEAGKELEEVKKMLGVSAEINDEPIVE